MTGASRHVQIPADDPEFLKRLAAFLDQDPSHPDARYAERCREAAAKLEKTPLPTITAASPLQDLIPHGVAATDINRIAQIPVATVGELCDHSASWIHDKTRGVGMKTILQLSGVLARFNIGFRPEPPKK